MTKKGFDSDQWIIIAILACFLWAPRMIKMHQRSTVMERLGNKTCELFRRGDVTWEEAMLQALKELGITTKTKSRKGTEENLLIALEKCGITQDSMK